MSFVNGIDVSDFQGNAIDWSRVRNAGYSFAIAKATQSTGNVQASFPHNISGIRAAGMVAGAYHFLSWTTDPAAQAEHFLSNYTPRNGDLPPTLDCEAVPQGMASDACVNQISRFLEAYERHLHGARMMLYMSFSFPDDHLNGGTGFSGHPLWVAAYNSSTDVSGVTPDAWKKGKVAMWQFSDGAIPHPQPAIDGLGVNIDRNRFIGDVGALHAFTLKGL